MATETPNTETRARCEVSVEPEIIDAGHEIWLDCSLRCEPPIDMIGRTVVIKDHDGLVVGGNDFTRFDGTTNRTEEFLVRVPTTPGECVWTAGIPMTHADGVVRDAHAGTFRFTVKAHVSSLMVWDVPSTVVIGESFALKVGIKGARDCPMVGREIRIHDHTGKIQARAIVGDSIWPGTDGVYVAEFSFIAQGTEGLQDWSAQVDPAVIEMTPRIADAPAEEVVARDGEMASDAAEEPPPPPTKIAHDKAVMPFAVRLVPAPECVVTIEAIRSDDARRLGKANVVMHPYRGTTDAEGRARLRVPKGSYKLFVSAPWHEAFAREIDVTEDVHIHANLVPEPEDDLARGYQ